MLKPLQNGHKVFTYRNVGFTMFVSQYENHIDFKVLSNLDSEVVFHAEIRANQSIEFLEDDMKIELDNYVLHNITTLERLYSRILDWGNQL